MHKIMRLREGAVLTACFSKSLVFITCFMTLLLYPLISSATALIIDNNGTSLAYTYNNQVGKQRFFPHTPDYAIPVGNAYIQKGALLPVYIPVSMRAETYDQWETVIFKLKEDLIVNGVVVAPANTTVFGTVTRSIEPELHDQVGQVRIQMDSLYTYRNVPIPLNRTIQRHNRMLDDRGDEFTSLNIFGANVHIPQNEVFLVEVAEDTDLGITLHQLDKFGVYFGIDPHNRLYAAALTNMTNKPY